jgi:AsmA protein
MMKAPFAIPRVSGAVLVRCVIGFGVLVAISIAALGAFIATRDLDAIERGMIARLEREIGGSFRYQSRRPILWPRPKIVYDGVRIETGSPALSVIAPKIVVRFDLSDLFDGEVGHPAITLVRPEATMNAGQLDRFVSSPRAIAQALGAISGALDAVASIEKLRLVVEAGIARFPNGARNGGLVEVSGIDLRIGFSRSRARIDIAARGGGADPLAIEATLPTLASLAGSQTRPAQLRISRGEANLGFAGGMRNDPDIALVGRIETRLDARFEAALFGGQAPPAASSESGTSARAELILDPRGIGLERLRIQRGDRSLAGIAALRETNGRWSLSSTLAGDLVDGSAAASLLAGLRHADGAWSDAPLAFNPAPGLDLDIRLSTPELRLGALKLANAAVSILTRAERVEFGIVDSRFGSGTVKARFTAISNAEKQDVRIQFSGDRIDGGAFLTHALGLGRITGIGNFVVQAEGRGRSAAALVASLSGAGQAELRAGEVAGIDLARLLARSGEARPELALAAALGGKTAFELLRLNFALRDGRIESTGSSFISPRVTATLEGVIDLVAQRDQMAIVLRRRAEIAGSPTEFFAFRLEGPLFEPSLKPDLSLLLDRS